MAPPRTTADINAILDREKPDAEKIAARKAEADAAPPIGAAPAALSQFYYDRAAARALLGRNQDALADGLQSLDAAKSSGEFGRITRVMQLVALRYRALGDPKKETETFDVDRQRSPLAQNKRGAMINPLANLARTALSIGRDQPGRGLCAPRRSAGSGGARQSQSRLAQGLRRLRPVLGGRRGRRRRLWRSRRMASTPRPKPAIGAPKRSAAPR